MTALDELTLLRTFLQDYSIFVKFRRSCNFFFLDSSVKTRKDEIETEEKEVAMVRKSEKTYLPI